MPACSLKKWTMWFPFFMSGTKQYILWMEIQSLERTTTGHYKEIITGHHENTDMVPTLPT